MLVLRTSLPLEKQIYYLMLRSGISLANKPFYFLLRVVKYSIMGTGNPIHIVAKEFSLTPSRIVQGIGRALAQAKRFRPEWLDFINGGPVEAHLSAQGLVALMVKWFDTHMVVELDNENHTEPYQFRFIESKLCEFY